jgi:sarcosine/dimethylglycine N-methyltransferase
VLKPGGLFVFTDPMQADDADPAGLQAVYDRLQLPSLGSFRFYREAAEALGFQTVEQEDLTHNLRAHYARVREDMLANREKLIESGASAEYLDKMAVGLENWVKAADAGNLAWGIQVFRKPD